jgi:hypothetical protein
VFWRFRNIFRSWEGVSFVSSEEVSFSINLGKFFFTSPNKTILSRKYQKQKKIVTKTKKNRYKVTLGLLIGRIGSKRALQCSIHMKLLNFI